MPAPGDQHTSIANPFAEPQQRISEYTAQEIATLQSRLEKQLGPEYLSSRQGPGGTRVHYISAEKCIALANEVFGFNGWSSSIQNLQIDYVDDQNGRVSLGLSVIVRVTLRDGTYHEDLGYGHIENAKGKAAAFEKAKKEGTTDALKRALRHFGNVLGNCIYDKSYLAKVTKMKVAPTKFDEHCLHRHPDFAVKKAPVEVEAPAEEKTVQPGKPPPQMPTVESFEDFLGELDEADFNISDEGHPDEVVLPNSNETESNHYGSNKSNNQPINGPSNPVRPLPRQLARASSAGHPPRQPPQTPVQQPSRPNTNNFPGAGAGAGPQNRGPPPGPRPPQQFNQNRPTPHPNNASNQNHNPQAHMTPPHAGTNNNNHNNSNAGAPAGDSVGFFSARAMKGLPDESLVMGNLAPKPGQAFNPHLQSPSIPRTPGVDHTASKPLSKNLQHVAPRKVEDEADGRSKGMGMVNKLQPPGPAAAAGAGSGGGGGAATLGNGMGMGAAPRPLAAGPGPRPANVVNPQLDQTRRIGAPGSSSPLGNRGQFRPLTVKRPAAAAAVGGDGPGGGGGSNGDVGVVGGGVAGRVPLGEVAGNTVVGGVKGEGGGVASGGDMKRQRTS